MSPRHRRFAGNRVLLCSSRCGTVPARSRHRISYRQSHSICRTHATAQGSRFTLVPSRQCLWWVEKPGVEDGALNGGRLGADVGSLVSPNGFCHVGSDTFGVARRSVGAGDRRQRGPRQSDGGEAPFDFARSHGLVPVLARSPPDRDNAQKTTYTISAGATAPDSNCRARECASRRPLRTWPDSGNWYSRKPSLSVEHQGINFFRTNRFLVGLRFRTP